jgi:hypothetical protein
MPEIPALVDEHADRTERGFSETDGFDPLFLAGDVEVDEDRCVTQFVRECAALFGQDVGDDDVRSLLHESA